jgi:hypothetical protein
VHVGFQEEEGISLMGTSYEARIWQCVFAAVVLLLAAAVVMGLSGYAVGTECALLVVSRWRWRAAARS